MAIRCREGCGEIYIIYRKCDRCGKFVTNADFYWVRAYCRKCVNEIGEENI